MICTWRGETPRSFMIDLIFAPVAVKSKTGFWYVVFTLILLKLQSSNAIKKEGYAKTPLKKIGFVQYKKLHALMLSKFLDSECLETSRKNKQCSLWLRQLKMMFLIKIAFISEPPCKNQPAQANFSAFQRLC